MGRTPCNKRSTAKRVVTPRTPPPTTGSSPSRFPRPIPNMSFRKHRAGSVRRTNVPFLVLSKSAFGSSTKPLDGPPPVDIPPPREASPRKNPSLIVKVKVPRTRRSPRIKERLARVLQTEAAARVGRASTSTSPDPIRSPSPEDEATSLSQLPGFGYLIRVLEEFCDPGIEWAPGVLREFHKQLEDAAFQFASLLELHVQVDYRTAVSRLRAWQGLLRTWIEDGEKCVQGGDLYWAAMYIGGSMPRLVRTKRNSGTAVVNGYRSDGVRHDWTRKAFLPYVETPNPLPPRYDD